jgi:hypothetical protein
MGRLIEESRTTTPMNNDEIVEALKTMVFGKQAFERFDAKERETLDKAWNIIDQYENRLKADLVAMLVRLNNEIDDLRAYDDIETIDKCEEIIQQKINSLKEAKDENEH